MIEIIAQELRTQRPWGGDLLSEEESLRIAKRLLELMQAGDDGPGALVERLDLRNGSKNMAAFPDGRYVRYSDYAALRADKERLRTFAHEATKAITGLTAGGSEYFGGEVDGIYLADLPLCVEIIRARFATQSQKAAEAKVERLERERDALSAEVDDHEEEQLGYDDDLRSLTQKLEAAERRLAELSSLEPVRIRQGQVQGEAEVGSPAWAAEQERLTGTCAWCRGTGTVRTRDYHDELSTERCPRCGGQGVVPTPVSQEPVADNLETQVQVARIIAERDVLTEGEPSDAEVERAAPEGYVLVPRHEFDAFYKEAVSLSRLCDYREREAFIIAQGAFDRALAAKSKEEAK